MRVRHRDVRDGTVHTAFSVAWCHAQCSTIGADFDVQRCCIATTSIRSRDGVEGTGSGCIRCSCKDTTRTEG